MIHHVRVVKQMIEQNSFDKELLLNMIDNIE